MLSTYQTQDSKIVNLTVSSRKFTIFCFTSKRGNRHTARTTLHLAEAISQPASPSVPSAPCTCSSSPWGRRRPASPGHAARGRSCSVPTAPGQFSSGASDSTIFGGSFFRLPTYPHRLLPTLQNRNQKIKRFLNYLTISAECTDNGFDSIC